MRIVLIAAAFFVAGCAEKSEPMPPFVAVGDMVHTMNNVIEPAADKIWDSSGYVLTAEGEVNLAPTTDEGWMEVKHGASVIADSGNLLMMPAHAQGREEWIAISRGLVEVGRQAMAAADARDDEALFETGAALYGVCLSCHQVYWEDGGRFTAFVEEKEPSASQ